MNVVNFDVIIHSVNIATIAGIVWAIIKWIVPAGISIRDSFRDTAKLLQGITDRMDDHENRLRTLEWGGEERRAHRRRHINGVKS